jgi:hypothetical protein
VLHPRASRIWNAQGKLNSAGVVAARLVLGWHFPRDFPASDCPGSHPLKTIVVYSLALLFTEPVP